MKPTVKTPFLDTIVPADPNVPYDMKDIIERVVDNGYFFEVMRILPRISSLVLHVWQVVR